MGYKVFKNVDYVFPYTKGHVLNLEFGVLEGGANWLSLSLAAAATLVMTF
jgi:hypothetical protein